MDLYKIADNTKTQEDFVLFLKTLIIDFKDNPEEWENNTLIEFLHGLEGYCSDKKLDDLSWNTLVKVFLAATVYE